MNPRALSLLSAGLLQKKNFCPFLLGTPENAGVVDLNEVQEELFASKEQHMMQLYCLRYLNNAYRFLLEIDGVVLC